MGWTFTIGATKADIVQELITPWTDSQGQAHRVLASRLVGHTLWSVWEHQGQRLILCCLLERSPDGWGYKDMDETMGPCYYDCPLQFLDLASPPPTPGYYSPEWREKVRAYHRSLQAHPTP